MKTKIIFLFLFTLLYITACGQLRVTQPIRYYNNATFDKAPKIPLATASDEAVRMDQMRDSIEGKAIYPAVGIPLSTGSAWGSSITNNSSTWNTVTNKVAKADSTGNAAGNYVTRKALEDSITAAGFLTIEDTVSLSDYISGISTIASGKIAVLRGDTSVVTLSGGTTGQIPILQSDGKVLFANIFGSTIIPANFNWTADNAALANKTWLITNTHTISGNVTIPTGVILHFIGGSLTGIDSITGTNTKIIAQDENIISAIKLKGSWIADKVWFKWFGAKGDATTDDYTKGQQLLDWAYDNNKLKVWMGIGRFRVVSSGFTVRTDLEGMANTTYGYCSEIYNRTTNGYGLKIYNSYIEVANITVYGNATGNYGVGATCGDGVLFDGSVSSGLQRCVIRNIISIRNSYGFRFTAGVWIMSFYDCYAMQNLYDGWNIDSGDGYPTNTGNKNLLNFYLCSGGSNGRNGWTIWGMSIHLYGCDAELNIGAGIDLNSTLSTDRTFDNFCYNTLISAMHFEGNGGGAIHCTAGIYNTKYFYIRGLIIEGCYIYDDSALMQGGRTNSVLFESFGSVNENTGAIKGVRFSNNYFGSNLSVKTNFANLLDETSYVDLPTGTEHTNFGRAANPNQYRTLVISGYFYAKGMIKPWTNILRSDTITTGEIIQFPLTLPTNCNINQYKIWVQTDATNYTITFSTVARDALTGIGNYGTSLIYGDAKTGNSGSKLISSSTTSSYTLSNRVLETKNDMYLTITVTIVTGGTYLYLGNPVVVYK